MDNAVADGHDIQEEVMFPRRAPSLLSIETLSLTKNQTLFAAYFPGISQDLTANQITFYG